MGSESWPPGYAAENSSAPLLNVCISFAIIETFFIIAFIFSWYFNSDTNYKFKPVFYCILIGYIFCFGGVVLGILKIIMGGAGYHVDTLKPKTIVIMLKLVKVHEFVYVSSILFPKMAILYLYLRLFASRTIHVIVYATAVLVIVTFLFGIFLSFLNCRPLDSFWTLGSKKDCTLDVLLVFRYYSIPNIAADVVVLLIPLPMLRKVRVGVMSKIGLYLTFMVMAFGIVTAVLRFVSFLEVDLFRDITYLSITTTSWTIIEPGVYLIAATMPTLRPLIRRIFRRANNFCPTPNRLTSCFRTSVDSIDMQHAPTAPQPTSQKKSSKSLHRDFFESIGKRPSRAVQLDDYHQLQHPEAAMLRSMDEESLVCADARTQERMATQGRNPDGTLQAWSLEPVELSPLRTSFLLR